MSTIKDVAREAGLSVGTVSRVLNSRGYLSEETRRKVEDAMERLGYEPNAIAQSLSKKASRLVGVIVPLLSHPFFSQLVGAISAALEERNMQMLLFVSDELDDRSGRFISECRRNRVAGIILCSGNLDASRIGELSMPLVCIERQAVPSSSLVECDNFEGGRIAARHLASCGAKSAVCITLRQEAAMPADNRASGFMAECRAIGLDCQLLTVEGRIAHSQDCRSEIDRLFDIWPDTDAVFATGDVIAMQALAAAMARGLRVPEDLLVMGFDDSPVCTLSTPSLTSISQPVDAMAQLAVETVIKAAEEGFRASSVRFPVSLVARASTCQALDMNLSPCHEENVKGGEA